jgi:hypothetical protein
MIGMVLLKTLIAAALISAAAITVAAGETLAQPEQSSLNKRANSVIKFDRRTSLQLAQELAASSRSSFDLGFAFVRAMYFAGLSDVDGEAHNKAILELVSLIERVEDHPEQVSQLQQVLKMVTRNSGTGEERWIAMLRVIKSYSVVLKTEPQWYFDSGVTISMLCVATYLDDSEAIKYELQNLQALTRIAPQNVPRNVLVPMQSLLRYCYQATFTEADRAALIAGVDKIVITVTA